MATVTNNTMTPFFEVAPSNEQDWTLIIIVIAFYCILTLFAVKSLCCYNCNPARLVVSSYLVSYKNKGFFFQFFSSENTDGNEESPYLHREDDQNARLGFRVILQYFMCESLGINKTKLKRASICFCRLWLSTRNLSQ